MTARSTQMSQIATSLAGTAAHELGHSLGLSHHDAYSHPSIIPVRTRRPAACRTPASWRPARPDIIETEREVIRSHGIWSKAKFDITGGAVGKIGGDAPQDGHHAHPARHDRRGRAGVGRRTLHRHRPCPSPCPRGKARECSSASSPATPTTPTARRRPITPWMSTSGGSASPAPAGSPPKSSAPRASAPAGTTPRWSCSIRPASPIFAVDNIHYDDDTYNTGTFQQTDPLLLNIPVTSPGFYYLRVTNPVPMEVGPTDAYWLLAGWQAVRSPSRAPSRRCSPSAHSPCCAADERARRRDNDDWRRHRLPRFENRSFAGAFQRREARQATLVPET